MDMSVKQTERPEGGDTGHVVRQQGRKVSLVSDSKLPPILEGQKNGPISPTTRKTRTSSVATSPTLSKTSSESGSPVGVPGRSSRSSVAESNFSFGGRRESLARKDSMMIRRESFRKGTKIGLPPLALNRKASFRTIGHRVATLLKAKNAFRSRKKAEKEEPEDDESAIEIKELPKQPRFASTLSPEAQYAMMKGYEDVVYSYLITSNPEYRPLLKRNKTPISGVAVREVGEEDKPDGRQRLIAPSPMSSTPLPEEPSTEIKEDQEAVGKDGSDSPRDTSMPSPRRRDFPREKSSITRTTSLPQLAPKNRQLVMTHRYQSAMDILDGIRKSQGLHSLSPRVKAATYQDYVPVKEYNSWSGVWSMEFETKLGAKTTKA